MTDNTGFSGLFGPQFRDESAGRVHCFHTRLFPGGSAGGSDISMSPCVADTKNVAFQHDHAVISAATDGGTFYGCNTCITTAKAEKSKLNGGLHLPPAQSTG